MNEKHSDLLTHQQLQSLTMAIIAFLAMAYEGVPVNEIISDMAEKIHAASEQNGLDGTTENTDSTPEGS